MKVINKDYIGVIVENTNKLLAYREITIDNSYTNIYEELEIMEGNENRTVLDLQNKFQQYFNRRLSPNSLNFCYPYIYSTHSISWATYPHCLTYEEYQIELKNNKSNSDLKAVFLRSANRYIIAYAYSQKIRALTLNSANKMFSSENIGWTQKKYSISQDIEISVNSNFCYGASSYFCVNLKYKGINILPYSDMVKYYYANMIDFIRFTRQYSVKRESWDYAFGFVVQTANYAVQDESAFINKWIFNEIEEMMKGLELMAKSPSSQVDKLRKKNNSLDRINVRNINSSEVENYDIYPTETTVSIQAEKITGALQLMKSLASLKDIYPKVNEVICRIKEINTELSPRFTEAIINIEKKLAPKQEKVNVLTEIKNQIIAKCKPHENKISIIYEKAKKVKDPKVKAFALKKTIKQEYIKSHEKYTNMLNEIDSIRNQIRSIENEIGPLKAFINQLNACIENIIKHTKVA